MAILGLSLLLLPGLGNGLAGFGFALFGTAILATVLDPATAVGFLIISLIAVNLSLAVGPTLLGVAVGARLRPYLAVRTREWQVVGLLSVVGIRLFSPEPGSPALVGQRRLT